MDECPIKRPSGNSCVTVTKYLVTQLSPYVTLSSLTATGVAERVLNRLYYGDNLEVMRAEVQEKSVDLVYLDPPFNSNRSYNVIFGRNSALNDVTAQIQAFDDTWQWTPDTDRQYHRYAMAGDLPPRVGEALTAFRTLLGENDAMAYLVNMAPRLVELHRVLKPTGSLYLHCDPTMSHYLKFFWTRSSARRCSAARSSGSAATTHNSAKRYGAVPTCCSTTPVSR